MRKQKLFNTELNSYKSNIHLLNFYESPFGERFLGLPGPGVLSLHQRVQQHRTRGRVYLLEPHEYQVWNRFNEIDFADYH